MRELFTVSQIREIDKRAIAELDYPSILLMENAAHNIYHSIRRKFINLKPADTIGILCGKGNNAGDGFAVARILLLQGFNIRLLLLYPEEQFSKDALTNYQILKNIKSKTNLSVCLYDDISSLDFLADSKLIIDAILGSGFGGELDDFLSQIIVKINSFNSLKVAIDIPTGLNADTGYGNIVFNSDFTITLAGLKPGLFINRGVEFTGEIVCENIGINLSWVNFSCDKFLVTQQDCYQNFPKRKKTANKYTSGKVLSIAGSAQYSGAADLVSLTPLKVGAGASVLTVPKSVRMNFGTYKETVIESYEDNGKGFLTQSAVDELTGRINWSDVISLGPGLGRNEETIGAIDEILKKTINKPVVIDADALYAIAKIGLSNVHLENKILTPHLGEFLILSGFSKNEVEKDLLNAGRRFVDENNCYLVLKGPGTIIFTPSKKIFINATGNSGLAKFGSGDVLTGIIAGILSQSKQIEASIISGVFLHGFTADILKTDFTEYGFTSSDLIAGLPGAIKQILSYNA